MRFDILTLFPTAFPGPLGLGVIGRALEAGTIELEAHDLRDWADNRHKQVDDTPYGGGAGMLLKPEPVFRAVRELRERRPAPVVLLTPQGRKLDHPLAEELAGHASLLIVSGRYEGFDERIRGLADFEVSIGDFVLTGGELAAMVLVEVVARLTPGVLGDAESTREDSFADGLLEYPQYTRPPEFEGLRVPDVLLSGDHQRIATWRREHALERTRDRRPDLLQSPNTNTKRKE
jgi:tRNA (guanine37-N1)-methyltransferase